jgi:hypothetical protein
VDAFEQLKQALVCALVLALPVWDKPFVLTTDWSQQAIGAKLSQVQPDTNDEHPIAYECITARSSLPLSATMLGPPMFGSSLGCG